MWDDLFHLSMPLFHEHTGCVVDSLHSPHLSTICVHESTRFFQLICKWFIWTSPWAEMTPHSISPTINALYQNFLQIGVDGRMVRIIVNIHGYFHNTNTRNFPFCWCIVFGRIFLYCRFLIETKWMVAPYSIHVLPRNLYFSIDLPISATII